MKANEFVKKFGLEAAKQKIDFLENRSSNKSESKIAMLNDLKRLVESYDLVESYMHCEDGQWFFIADYCKKNRISPFDSENYEKVKSIYL